MKYEGPTRGMRNVNVSGMTRTSSTIVVEPAHVLFGQTQHSIQADGRRSRFRVRGRAAKMCMASLALFGLEEISKYHRKWRANP